VRIIGIDPGSNLTGYGIIESDNRNVRLIEGGVIKLSQSQSLEKRLERLHNELTQIFKEFSPEEAAIEEVYSHYKYPKTAVVMGHTRGVILLTLQMYKIKIFNYSATKVKNSVTGSGRASKEQVQSMVKVRLKLNEVPKPFDVADALACAICHANHLKLKAI
jgi:crossover junction endodeoxyribonuclease RuvC